MNGEELRLKLTEMKDFLKEHYQYDNIDIVMERAQTILQYQADIPSMLGCAEKILGIAQIPLIQPGSKHAEWKVKILCHKEQSMVTEIKEMRDALSHAGWTSRSYIATLRHELMDNMQTANIPPAGYSNFRGGPA